MLLLWDIDGTLLLNAADAHADAMQAAITETYGIAELPQGQFELAGMTDPAIARRLLTLAGVDAKLIDDKLPEFFELAVREYVERAPESLADRINPGVDAVLDELTSAHDFALVTGNLEPIARIKLRAAGIGHHFASGQGGFGSDSEDRAELPPIARRRAGDHPREDTVVIGDTPRDIACARADGVRVIAIATGPFAAGDLGHADVVVTRASDLPGAIQSL